TLSCRLHLIVLFVSYFSTLPSFLFFNAPPPTDIYTLSLHDALPISPRDCQGRYRLLALRAANANWASRRWQESRTIFCLAFETLGLSDVVRSSLCRDQV